MNMSMRETRSKNSIQHSKATPCRQPLLSTTIIKIIWAEIDAHDRGISTGIRRKKQSRIEELELRSAVVVPIGRFA